MRAIWKERYDSPYRPALVTHLSHLLYMKRTDKSAGASQPEPGDAQEEEIRAFASQEETVRAILSVLKDRQSFLTKKGRKDMRHIFDDKERSELCKRMRQKVGNMRRPGAHPGT